MAKGQKRPERAIPKRKMIQPNYIQMKITITSTKHIQAQNKSKLYISG